MKTRTVATTLLVSDSARGKETANCRIKHYRDHNVRIQVNVTNIRRIILQVVTLKEDCFIFLCGEETLLCAMLTCIGYINSLMGINY